MIPRFILIATAAIFLLALAALFLIHPAPVPEDRPVIGTVTRVVDGDTIIVSIDGQKSRVRYIGITTSHGRDHEGLLQIMRSEPLDFVQFSYNIQDRVAEQALLPVAQDRGIATMINRPYQRGALFGKSRGHELPDLAAELDCGSWGQFYLKFILGHRAVTCIIPATAKVHHMADNMQANFGRLPDAAQREEMLRIFEAL